MSELNANPAPEWAAYDAAVHAWQDEIDRVDLNIGASAAVERADEALLAVIALRDKIAATRATPLAGIKFKAKYVAEHDPGAPDEEVMESIIADIIAMEG
jgi:hypothetical protein